MEIREEQEMEKVLRDVEERLSGVLNRICPLLSGEQRLWFLTGAVWVLQHISKSLKSSLFLQLGWLLDRVVEFLARDLQKEVIEDGEKG